MAGVTVWIKGLSGAGKTTLLRAIESRIEHRVPKLVTLDGDEVRAAFGNDLDHDEAARRAQLHRLQSLCRLLNAQGVHTLVAAVYSTTESEEWLRTNLENYFEIYIHTCLETVLKRDSKGLYQKALTGQIRDVVGIDIPMRRPEKPDLVLDGNTPRPPDELADQVIGMVKEFRLRN